MYKELEKIELEINPTPGQQSDFINESIRVFFFNLKFFLKIYLCVWVFFLNVCSPHVCLVSVRSEGIGSPGTGARDGCEPLGTEPEAFVRERSAPNH